MAIKFNRSQTFATNGTVTAAGLHNLIDGTDIYQALITDQTAMTSVGSLDKLLIADSDLTAADAPRSVTVNELFEDALTLSTYTNVNAVNFKYTSATGNYTLSTGATITNGTIANAVIPTLTAGTTTSTAATITSGTIPTLTTGTTISTAEIVTSGTIATLNSTTGTIATLRSTTGTIGNLSTTLAGDFTISQGTGTLATSGATAGTYGSVTAIPFITVDAKGRITSATTGTFSTTPADGSITPAKLSQPFTSGTAVASTSGTAIDFTGIPSWVKRVTVMLNEVSTSGTNQYLIQLGSGGITNSGYVSTGGGIQSTVVGANTSSTGFLLGNTDGGSGWTKSGSIIINTFGSNTWICLSSLTVAGAPGARVEFCSGRIALAGVLDRVRVTTVGGTETFDAGSINISYE